MNSENRIARHPTQHPTYVFPPTMSDVNLDPRLVMPSLMRTREAFSSPIRPPADMRMGTTCPPVSATLANPKTGLQKATAMLEIQHLKERLETLKDENENLKNSISKIKREARKERTHIGEELIAVQELIGAMQQESKARFERIEVDDDDEGSDSSKGMIIDDETVAKIEKSHAAVGSNVFLVSFHFRRRV